METKFTAVAMRCTQEQFEAIKPKLEGYIDQMSSFVSCSYLTNNLLGRKMSVSNISKLDKERRDRTVYETWNEATFLRACGIEVDEPLTVSKEFILEAHNAACSTWKRKLEEKFPSVFVKDELEVGKWYKKPTFGKLLFLFSGEFSKTNCNIHPNYGFDYDGSFSNTIGVYKTEIEQYIPATHQEVETALINEAKKRGFKEGVTVKDLSIKQEEIILSNSRFDFYFKDNDAYMGGACIFDNGQWAEIIEQPTEMTVAEIEQKLGLKIKIVG